MNTSVEKSKSDTSKFAADGSALYYALLYVEQPAATRAVETLQFIQTLSRTLIDVTEAQVAEKKIHWWHEELARLAKQQARHPTGITVQHYLHDSRSIEASLKILSATATERYTPIATEQELHEMILSDYAARLSLLDSAIDGTAVSTTHTDEQAGDKPIQFLSKAEIVGNNHKSTSLSKTDAIASGLGQFDRLNSLLSRLRSGYPVFSDERYKKYELSPDDLLNHAAAEPATTKNTQDKIHALLGSAITDTHTCLENAVACIAKTRKSDPSNLTVQILCQIRCAQLKLWKKRKPNLLNESVTLTPLRKFFIAYRCKRRFEQI